MDSDWTNELFIEHGDLVQVLLEERFTRAEGEAQGLTHLFLDARRVERLAPRRFDAGLNMYTSLGYYGEETDASILRRGWSTYGSTVPRTGTSIYGGPRWNRAG